MRVLVVGGGIVGCAAAFRLRRDGHEITLLDRDPAGDKTSFGNAAGIGVTEIVPASFPGIVWRVPGWLIDPLGPLALDPRHLPRLAPWLVAFLRAGAQARIEPVAAALAALNRLATDDIRAMMGALGLGAEVHEVGALSVYRTEAGFAAEAAEWALRRRHGIEWREISGAAARELEPALSPEISKAIFIPGWSHVSDPRRIVLALQDWLRRNGAAIETGTAVAIRRGEPPAIKLSDGRELAADRIVVAAGAWSAPLAASIGDRVLLESERGYNTTIPEPGLRLSREVIFAEAKFVATPLAIGLRIGGAAEFAGLERAPDWRRSKALLKLAHRYLPGLRDEGGTEWMGHRPATPDSLPVIGPSPRDPCILYAFGHGHVGLTQSATTGRIVADLVAGRRPPVELAPYAIGRFARR